MFTQHDLAEAGVQLGKTSGTKEISSTEGVPQGEMAVYGEYAQVEENVVAILGQGDTRIEIRA